jgi:hypothetical protein
VETGKFFLAVLFLLSLMGCNPEGISLDNQKSIPYEVTVKGESKNWEITDEVNGEYYDIEKTRLEEHRVRIKQKKEEDVDAVEIVLPYKEEGKEHLIRKVDINEKGVGVFTEYVTSNLQGPMEKGEIIQVEIRWGEKMESVTLK